ncbi:MAG TPA: efflux RND transporter periplasmic adaptor subunit [Thermodesulfobacteriota bacterium]|nr:efflux RND transporter periplasmic adaptor subunit [Thermodesulfobacteriota bacterium]
MTKEKRKTIFKAGLTLVLFVLIFLGLYSYGYKIPVINQIPFLSTKHEHQYRPVFSEEGEIEYWTCTMHPSVKLKDPGTCPLCGMDLVPVKKKEITQRETESEKMEGMEGMPGMGGMQGMQGMPGMGDTSKTKDAQSKSAFTVSPQRQQLIGVKTEPAKVRPMKKVIRTVGIVELDETKIKDVNTKISGWIDKVFVDFKWEHVKKGEPLFSIYSPELVSTQEEYLLALRSKKILGDSQFAEIASSANSLLEASRTRLLLWDISEDQIRKIERTGKVSKSLTIHSPATGFVTEKNVFENMYVEPNTKAYTIADHSVVWVDADIYENEISLVKLGQEAKMTVASLPGEEFPGKIIYILPHLMPETRTIKVRFGFPNPDLKLLPQMYANVELEIPLGERLTVAESAVLRTGKQDLVFVDKGEGNMEIRRIELGQNTDGMYEVLGGLKEGEKVVSRANFLIDAESKIQAAVATWEKDTDGNDEAIYEMEFLKENGDAEKDKQKHVH